MAIFPNVPGISVHILVDGQPLLEYNNPDDEEVPPNTVLNYIEAVTGAKFDFQFSVEEDYPHRNYSLKAEIYIDGKYQDNGIFRWTAIRATPTFSGKLCGLRVYDNQNKKWSEKPYHFGELLIAHRPIHATNTTGAAEQYADAGKVEGNPQGDLNKVKDEMAQVGDIEVRLHRVKMGKKAEPKAWLPPAGLSPVPEKALKGRTLSHSMVLGQPKETDVGVFGTEKLDDGPFAKFIFRYRSRNALQSMHVIPRSPTPVPLEDRDPSSLTNEELRELVRRMKEREGASAFVKKEIKQELVPRENIKQEGIARGGIKREREEGGDDELTAIDKIIKRARVLSEMKDVIDLENDNKRKREDEADDDSTAGEAGTKRACVESEVTPSAPEAVDLTDD